jgi:REP element-mobilizing transposase RayT
MFGSTSDSNGNLEHRKRCHAPTANNCGPFKTFNRSAPFKPFNAGSGSRIQTKTCLKFARDQRCYLRWVFEAMKRFGLCVLDYAVTSNHIHLLVKDTRPNVIAQSMQLIAGRTAQEYNQRRAMQGAFWQDRYHATAIEIDEHLHRCVVYIDLNMVRAIEYCSPFQLFQTFNRFAPFKTFQINGRSKFKVQNVQREALVRSDRGWQLVVC